jgi:hypothetical protein
MIFNREIDINGSEPTPDLLEIRPVLFPSGKSRTYTMDVHLVFNVRQTGSYAVTARITPVLNLARFRSRSGKPRRLVVNVYQVVRRAKGCEGGVLPTVHAMFTRWHIWGMRARSILDAFGDFSFFLSFFLSFFFLVVLGLQALRSPEHQLRLV